MHDAKRTMDCGKTCEMMQPHVCRGPILRARTTLVREIDVEQEQL